jgi:hypothetical protein
MSSQPTKGIKKKAKKDIINMSICNGWGILSITTARGRK